MLRGVNLKLLETFVAVAESGSLSRAAVTLNRGQPLVSRQVRELELDLGIDLFRRTGRGVALSNAGARLLVRARRILEDVADTRREMRALDGAQLAEATIALPSTVARLAAKELTGAILAAHPDARLHLMEGTSGPILEWLLARRVDLAVLYDTVAVPRTLTEPLCTETMYLVRTAALGPLPETTPVGALEAVPLILPSRSEGLRSLMEVAAFQAGIRLNVRVEADTLSLIRMLVEGGHGCAVLPLTALRDEVANGSLVISRLVEPEVTRGLVIATSTAHLPAAALNELVRMVVRVVRAAIDAPAGRS